MKLRWWIGIGVGAIIGVTIGLFLFFTKQHTSLVLSPLSEVIKEKPLEKYAIEQLLKREFFPTDIFFDAIIATESSYVVRTFHYLVDGKKVTGLAHIPRTTDPAKKFPVVVQFRGYVEKERYTPGEGTKRSAAIFAQHGFLSLAPDFLGYGGSDAPSEDAFEDRFLTYTGGLQLLASVKTLPMADINNIFVWGHSNGGHIALTLATILGKSGYPTTLWAPVTKPFPYSILYYTDEFDDLGKALRKGLANFEKDYDVDLYSMTSYIDRIAVPLQIHQGLADEPVPFTWNDQFVASLKEKGKDIRYFRYEGTDHNMMPSWNTVVGRDISFFTSYMK